MENEKLGEMTVEEDTDGKAVWVFEGKIKTDVPLDTDADTVVEAINELAGKLQDGGGGDDPLIEPWERPSDWPELPTPKDNQVIFLVTTAYNSNPYCSFTVRLLDKQMFPEEYSTFPEDFTASVDWGNGGISTAVVNPNAATPTSLLWTNQFHYLGYGVLEWVEKREGTSDQPSSYYYDISNSDYTGKYWIAGGTVLEDGSRVFVVTVTLSHPELVTISYPTNCYALDVHIGRNINIEFVSTGGTITQTYLQHVKAFGWQPKNNKYVYYHQNGTNFYYYNGLFSNSYNLRKIDATEPFTEITDRMFLNIFWLPEMDLSQVEIIGEEAFKSFRGYYHGLKTRMFNLLKCKEIKNCAFQSLNCNTKIVAPELEILGEQAFANAYGIVEIDIPKVKVIPNQCFYACYQITKINAPMLEAIEGSGFRNCQNLVSINAPNLKRIGSYGFSGCYNLREGNFPLLENIEDGAFDSCNALEKLVYSEGTNLNNAGLDQSMLWYDNPRLISRRPIDIH